MTKERYRILLECMFMIPVTLGMLLFALEALGKQATITATIEENEINKCVRILKEANYLE